MALNTVILSAQEELLDPLKAIMEEVLREESENSQQAADSQGGSLFD